MKSMFSPGDIKKHSFKVSAKDKAQFNNEEVHPVCATFTLAREMEWSSRLFVIDLLEEGEEGIGTALEIQHLSPALVGDVLNLVAKWEEQQGDVIFCSVEIKCGDRLIAVGKTQQKIVDKERFNKNLSRLAVNGKR